MKTPQQTTRKGLEKFENTGAIRSKWTREFENKEESAPKEQKKHKPFERDQRIGEQ